MRVTCALLAFYLLAPLDPALAREFKISHQWPAQIDARDRAVRIFVKEVQSRISGMSFQIFPQLSLKMTAEEQFGAMQSGKLDMSVYVLPYAVKQVPEFSLAVLPALYPSLDAARGLKDSKIGDQLQAVANAHGVHIVAWWWVPGGFVTRNREIAGPDTVKGLRLRGGDPLFDLMLKKAGAIPVDLTSNEIYAAMQSGKIDGALTSYETFVSTKIYEHGKYFTAGSPGVWMFATPLLISKSVWDSLSDSRTRNLRGGRANLGRLFCGYAGRGRSKVHRDIYACRRQVSQIHLRGISGLATPGAADRLEGVSYHKPGGRKHVERGRGVDIAAYDPRSR